MKSLILTIAAAVLLTGVAQADVAAPPAQAQGKPGKAAHKEMREKFKAENEAMKDKIETACSAEAGTAGCSQEMGKGLMKCIHAYKKSHADFKMSEGCVAATHEGREMREQRKMTRKSWKDKKAGEAAPATPAPTENK